MKKRIAALLLALVMVLSLMPTAVFAEDHANQVRVIVENTTFTKALEGGENPAWTGTLVDEWVALSNDSTVMTCVVAALDNHGYTQSGAENNYISSINGLAAGDGGSASGWMGTLNDWFTNEGFGGFTVAKRTLEAGDEIRIMYTSNGYGADLGGSWANNDKTVKALTFSAGTLDKEFNKDTHEYTLTVPADVTAVKVTPTASNKNFQVRTSVGKIEYKRTAMVPVENGTVITVKCGDPSWPSMNNQSGGTGATVPAETYTITVKAEGETPVTPPADAQNVTFKGLHDAQLKYLKVYRVGDETTNLLKGLDRITDGYKYKYETKLSPGEYLVKGYDEHDDFNGSLVLTVKEGENVFDLQRAYGIYATNSGWVKDTDYTIAVKVMDEAGNDLKAVTGTANYLGTVRTSCIFLVGGTIEVTLLPIGNKEAGYLPATVICNKTGRPNTVNGAIEIKTAISQIFGVTVKAPVGSTVQLGVFADHYIYTFKEAEKTVLTTGSDMSEYIFQWPETNSNSCFVRVQHPDGVTYWSFGKWTNNQIITVTKDDLHIGDSSFTKTTVYHNFEKNVYDVGDVYLNINRQGYKNIDVGQSFELDVFRNWQAIESFFNSQIALPDVHYRVIDVNGNNSDILTITPDVNNSSIATVTAKQAGTAIVLVTYDAMTHAKGMGGKELSAIWPECTGVFVVTVGADGTAIETNTFIDRPGVTVAKEEQKYLDAEHDILFYLGSKGASYSFKPEDGCTVTVARSTVGSTMSFNGFTADGVSVAADGTVTVKGLTTGRHILKIEKNGVANYQVVTARSVSYDLLDANDNVLDANTELKPGDTVKLRFHNVISPKQKMARIYNFNFALCYQDANGKTYKSPSGQYDFSSNSKYHVVTVKIPDDYKGVTYNLTGAITVGGYAGALPSHRGVSYTQGLVGNTGTSSAAVLAQLPEVALKLVGYNEIQAPVDKVEDMINAIGTVSKDSGKALAAARAAYNALSDEQKALVPEEVLKALEKAEADYAKLLSDSKYEPNPLKPGNNSSAKNPYQKDNKTDTKADSKDVKSGNTGDAGIALYVGMGLLAAMGGAVVIGRKKKAN